MSMINNIEDCIELLAGLHQSDIKFNLDKSDERLFKNIARHTCRGTALTDRQMVLMQKKMADYKHQFEPHYGDSFQAAILISRLPLRTIDRSKHITIQDNMITVRFPFNKTNISLIRDITKSVQRRGLETAHRSGSGVHQFKYTQDILIQVITAFVDREFEIDEQLMEIYTDSNNIKLNPERHLSGIDDGKIINVKPALVSIMQSEIGELTDATHLEFLDRRFRYGFNYFDTTQPVVTLVDQIVSRNDMAYHSKPSLESTDDILDALGKLNRLPLLVVIEKEHAVSQLKKIIDYYEDTIPSIQQSVLFRIDAVADTTSRFNNLIKLRKLNNWVDKTTKIVYISKDKLPKLLVGNDWKPSAAFSYNSKVHHFVNSYISANCDLNIFREETVSSFRRPYWHDVN